MAEPIVFGDEFDDDDEFGSGFGDSPGPGQPGDEFGRPFEPGGQDIVGGGGGGGFTFDLESLTNLLIGLGVGLVNANNANAAREATTEQLAEARKFASPENFINVFKTLQPLFREIVASGAGPQLTGAILGSLGKSGGKDTARGQALAAAGAGAGETLALGLTQQETGRVQAGQVSAALGSANILAGLQPRVDPIISALEAGAAGFFATSTLAEKDPTKAEAKKDLFPGIQA